ncbi:MAG: nitroreductase family protein [Lachnospiraceae bacterium]|nr:nitroreductase family protein [Lachnospiraceae bacterium]
MNAEFTNMKELVKANRSYRGYDESRRVTREELLEMVDCARLTASSVNQQPLRYFLAYEKEDVDRIQPLTKWARGLPDMELPHPGMYPTAFIVICQDTRISESLSRFSRDVGIAAQTILLCATEMGLGGCMIGNFSPAQISEAVHLPEQFTPLLVVAIGKPAEKIILTEIEPDEPTNYYRDEEDTHYVPKRRLKDIVIN